MTILNALCKGGPLDGKVRAHQSSVLLPPGATGRDGGFYVYRPAAGPTPATWVWVAPSKEKNNV